MRTKNDAQCAHCGYTQLRTIRIEHDDLCVRCLADALDLLVRSYRATGILRDNEDKRAKLAVAE